VQLFGKLGKSSRHRILRWKTAHETFCFTHPREKQNKSACLESSFRQRSSNSSSRGKKKPRRKMVREEIQNGLRSWKKAKLIRV
jgi:hypothetical protein